MTPADRTCMNKITWIAELGINAHGDFEKMKRMCKRAYEAGATYIKGQFYNPYRVLGRKHPDLNYALQCQFTRQQHEDLSAYCMAMGASYFVSVFDIGDVAWANRFSQVHKIASRMNTNQEFISKIDQCKKMTFMSIQPELGIRIPDRFKLMWCLMNYPSVVEDIMKYPYNANLGLSSHCPDVIAIEYAINQGAEVIEAHLCESRKEEGCDISSSLEFEEFSDLIKRFSMGTSDAATVSKVLTPSRKD